MSLRQSMVLSAALGGLVSASLGCLFYEADDKCGPNMTYNKDAHICACDEQSVQVAGGCKRCAKDRVPNGGACVCPPGSKESADGTCETVAGLGDACDATKPCQHPVYSYCSTDASGSGICTNPCSSDDACDDGYTCANWTSTPHCLRFSGVGQSCTMPGLSDPACSGDADYCFMGQCFLRGCTVTAEHATDDCPRDRKCCDVSFLNVPGVKTACLALNSGICQ